MVFQDRVDAGERLADELEKYREESPLVLGLPRGGVEVAYQVARRLQAPLDVWVARKIGAPMQPELGIGAISEGGELVLNHEAVAMLGISEDEVNEIIERESAEVERRVRIFRGDRPPPQISGRTVILVDDGIATGGTALASCRAIRNQSPRRLILAAPVASADTLEHLRAEVDDIVCLEASNHLAAIGYWYRDFDQVSTDTVVDLLRRAQEPATPNLEPVSARLASLYEQPRPIEVPLDGSVLKGDLTIPANAEGIVLFAHGSGSGRHSPRNRFVANELNRRGLATLLLDLLTREEERLDEQTGDLRFDIPLLAGRLLAASEMISQSPPTSHLVIGYFGASTGAAAALIAAAQRPERCKAVVSRGGRPDLAGSSLASVQAPTLLIVGEADVDVLELNEEAASSLRCPYEIAVIPGATHLFEEPGALDDVADLAGSWFVQYLSGVRSRARGERSAA